MLVSILPHEVGILVDRTQSNICAIKSDSIDRSNIRNIHPWAAKRQLLVAHRLQNMFKDRPQEAKSPINDIIFVCGRLAPVRSMPSL